MRKTIQLFLATVLLAVVAVTGCDAQGSEDASDYPSKDLDWTIAFGPGGGNDIMARTLVDLIKKKKMYPHNIEVENRDGGSGAVGWGYVYSKRGDPYVISTTSGSFITTPLESDTGWKPTDFTPIALVATDDYLFVTRQKSGLDTWQKWVDHAKQKKTVAVGGIGTVNVDFILHSKIAKQSGYKIDYVPFNDEGQLQTALLSGALDAAFSNVGEILGQVEAKKTNALLYTGKKPHGVIADVPTATSLGLKGLISMPRGMILPPDTPKDVQDWWIATMKKVVKTKEWKAYIAKNYLTEDVRYGKDFTKYLNSTSSELTRILREEGAIK